jgi:RNA polymerase sigma factor (sigma-70 family)
VAGCGGVAVASETGARTSEPTSPDPGLERQFARLWRVYYRRLWAFVRSFAAVSSEEAEDAVQEIMWKIYRALASYDRARPSAPWVFRIARNHCIDRMRLRGSSLRSARKPLQPEELEDAAPGPLDALILTDTQAHVRRFMETLSPSDRQILFLRYYERLRVTSVAAGLGMPAGTVKYRIHELKKKLRATMEETP